jgi:hypothetical protein
LLIESMKPVLRDIRATGAPTPEIRDDDWAREVQVASAMVFSPDGSGTGIRITLNAPEHERIMELADQIQEWVIEELWGQASTNWPRCPEHPRSHPLAASSRGEQAVWVCPHSGRLIAAVGSLR